MFDPVQSFVFWGFISDSVKQAFILPYEKKKRFATLRDSLIGMKLIPIKSLQKFAGKVVSFSLAISAAKLFCREVNFHIGKGLRSSKPVRMSKNLKNELEHWIFVDSWEGFSTLETRKTLYSRNHLRRLQLWLGMVLSFPGGSKETRDYWCLEDFECPGSIAVKEAKALFQTLSTFSEDVLNRKVGAFADNKNLLDFWNNEGGRNIPLTNKIKDLFFITLKLNILLNVYYVWSALNDADSPSRFSSDIDCSPCDLTWALVEASFCPHSVDLMAIPSNV